MAEKKEEIKVFVYRGFCELETGIRTGKYQQYEIPFVERMTILDVLNYIYENFDRSLSYYYSCRTGNVMVVLSV